MSGRTGCSKTPLRLRRAVQRMRDVVAGLRARVWWHRRRARAANDGARAFNGPTTRPCCFAPRSAARSLPMTTTAGAREYRDNLRRLYGSIVSEMGAEVIVDSSKVPSYAIALASLPNVDLRVVHLVRDPRATSYSWSRHIDRSDAGRPLTMERLDTWESAARWCSWNATTELLPKLLERPTVRVSYEGFVRDPKATLSSVLELVADVARRGSACPAVRLRSRSRAGTDPQRVGQSSTAPRRPCPHRVR